MYSLTIILVIGIITLIVGIIVGKIIFLPNVKKEKKMPN